VKDEIKVRLDFDSIVSLLKGEGVIVLGSADEPSINLMLKNHDIPDGLPDALDKLEMWWALQNQT
jgi:hypothetical protein